MEDNSKTIDVVASVNLPAAPVENGKDQNGECYVRINNLINSSAPPLFIPLNDFSSSKGFKHLNQSGAPMLTSVSRNAFLKQCEAVGQRNPSFEIITIPGFYNGHYVRPDGIFPPFPKGQDVRVQLNNSFSSNDLAQYRRAGSLQGWQKILPLSVGNSRLIFMLCLQFVGPVSAIIGSVPAVFLLHGPGQQGKTAMIRWASSVHGWDKDGTIASNLGFGTSLNTTSNALERHLASRRHSFAFLDEANQIGTEHEMAKAVLKCGFNIDGGESKKRLVDGNPDWKWSMGAVITSNHSFAEIVKKTGSKIGAHNIDRLVDIGPPATGYGMFEDLHGHSDIPSFVKAIEAIVSVNHGVAATSFLTQLGTQFLEERSWIADFIEKREAIYTEFAHKRLKPGHRVITRLTQSFARVYAVGRLAAHFKILDLPWREMRDAVLACQADHLRNNEHLFPAPKEEKPTALELLRKYVNANMGKFINLDKAQSFGRTHDPETCQGFLETKSGHVWVLLTNSVFEKAVGGDKEGLELKADLAASRALKVANAGTQKPRYVIKRPVGPKNARYPVVAVRLETIS